MESERTWIIQVLWCPAPHSLTASEDRAEYQPVSIELACWKGKNCKAENGLQSLTKTARGVWDIRQVPEMKHRHDSAERDKDRDKDKCWKTVSVKERWTWKQRRKQIWSAEIYWMWTTNKSPAKQSRYILKVHDLVHEKPASAFFKPWFNRLLLR